MFGRKKKPVSPQSGSEEAVALERERNKQRALSLPTTHIVTDPHGNRHEVAILNKWDLCSKQTGECLSMMPGSKVVELVNRSEAEKMMRRSMLELLDKMLTSPNVRTSHGYYGMGSQRWEAVVVDKFGGEGPRIVHYGPGGRDLKLIPNGPTVELTISEIEQVHDKIEAHENRPLSIEQVEALL